MKTVTYDPEQWQLVPKRATVEMLEEMMFATTYDNAWSQALASAPQHPDTIKIPRPEGHDFLSIEIKTSYGGGGGGSCSDTGETTQKEIL